MLEVLFEGNRAVGVRVKPEDGPEREVRAKVVIDASGQSTLIIDRFGLREWDPKLKKAALWTYWKGARRDTGRDEGATLVIQTEGKEGWFWYIPLHDDIDLGRRRRGSRLPVQDAAPRIPRRSTSRKSRKPRACSRASRTRPERDIFRIQKEYTYRAKQVAGDGWCLVGDAFGFLDPLYSSGLLLALTSG